MPHSATQATGGPGGAVSRRPFALLLIVAVVSLAVPVDHSRPGELALAFGCLGALGFLQLALTTWPSPAWAATLPTFGCFVVIAVLRDATGGSGSGLTALVLAPALYLALTGGRRQLAMATVMTALTFALPVLLIGAPDYTAQDWRRALVWTAVVGVFGTIAQQMVRSLAEESTRARRSQHQLQVVLDSAELSSMIVTDPRGLITSVGVGAERLLGRRAEDLVGTLNFADLHELDELLATARELKVRTGFAVFAALARSRAESRVWTWRDAGGAEIVIRSAVTELRDGDELIGYLAVGIDVTAEVQSRRALTDTEQRWRIVMRHLPDTTLLVVDRHLDVTLVSGAGSMREKLEDKTGHPLCEVASPHNAALLTELTTQALAGRSGVVDLDSARTGHEHEVAVVPLPHENGTSDALILARDVSRDRARSRALQQAKERAERMFDDAPIAILLHESDGRVLAANPAAVELFETAREELVGTRLSRLGVTEDPSTRTYLARLREGASSVHARWHLDLGPGREKYLSLTGRSLHDDPDHPDLVLTHVLDNTEQQLHEQQLEHLADHDPLTGLANRRRFGAELTRHLETCRRYGPEGAILVIDLDHFKQVNDTLGHPVGDQLLIAVSDVMTADLRASDTVARLGGDEFAVLLPRVSRADVEVVASSLVRTVRRSMLRHDGPAGEVTASLGVAMIDDGDQTPEQLLATADLALYQAKARGRDQFAVHDAHLAAKSALTGLRSGLGGRARPELGEDAG